MTHMIISPQYTPSTHAAEDQSAGVRDPIVDAASSRPDGNDVSFADLVDVVNPLQHIPLVASLYREITGDDIARGPQVIGDVLFTGPGALVSAGARALFGDDAPAKVDGNADQPAATTAGKPKADMRPADVAKAAPAAAEPRSNAAALAALARDMRGLSPPPPPANSENARPARPADPDGAATPKPHANLPPSGASPEWIARAMSRALTKYHNAARTAEPPPHYSVRR